MNGFTWLLTHVLGWSAQAFVFALQAAGGAALLAVAVALANVVGRRWLSARQMGLLWGLVLLRLLLPIAPGSSFSLQNLVPVIAIEMGEPRDPIYLADGGYNADPPPPHAAAAPHAVLGADTPAPDDSLLRIADLQQVILPLAWLLGAIATLLCTAIVHLRFCRRMRQVPASDDARLCGLWQSCCQDARTRGEIPILLTDHVDQPAVSGVWRPRLLLPEHAAHLADEQLRMIMLHELAHVRRRHLAVNWALVAVRALHWWNPVYWLAAARFQNLREQACDAFAIQRMEGAVVRDYGELLLALAGREQSRTSWRIVLPVSIIGFISAFFRKRAVRNRLRALRTAKVKRSGWHTAAVAALIGVAGICGMTDAGTPAAPPQPAWDWLPLSAVRNENEWQGATDVEQGELVTRSYDVARALRRIAADEPSTERARSYLKWQAVALIGGYEADQSNPSIANVKAGYESRVALDGVTLTVNAPLSVHAEVERNLRAWEKSGFAQICVETRLITDERDLASDLGISWRYLEASSDDRGGALSSASKNGALLVRANATVDDYLPITVANLNADQTRRLTEAAQQGRTANLLQAPKITLINGQRAAVVDRTQTPFVVGVQNAGNGARRPTIAVIDEGIKLNVRATQSGDDTGILLEAQAELSEIDEVRTASTMLNGESTTTQLPRVRRSHIDVSSEVPDGESLLLGCIPSYDRKRFFYVLLTARNLGP